MTLVAEQRRVSALAWLWRGLLCALLLFTELAADDYRTMRTGSLEQLYSDTRSGRAEVIEYSHIRDNKTYRLRVRWATGPFSWYEVFANGKVNGESPELMEAFPEQYKGPQGHTFQQDFDAANSAGHVRVTYLDHPSDRTYWWSSTYLDWWSAPALIVSAALLILMLSTREHHHANRWAWFWMFLLTPLGPIGYLLLERRPSPPGRPPRTSRPMGGFQGFLFGLIVLPLLFAILAMPLAFLAL